MISQKIYALLTTIILNASGCGIVASSRNENDNIERIVAAASELSEPCYCLKENEHILPDNVVNTFTTAIGGSSNVWQRGYYLQLRSRAYAPAKMLELRRKFSENMQNNGYSLEQIQSFFAALTQPGTIVIKESTTRSHQFKETIEHERVHYEFDKLSAADKDLLISFHQELMRKNDIWKRFSDVMGLTFYNEQQFGNGEFAAYLVTNAWFFVDNANKDFPREYEILHNIKEATKAAVCDCEYDLRYNRGQK